MSCEEEDRLLVGDWQATVITLGGDTLPVDASQVGFRFTDTRRYHYRSTLRYEEAGTWRYDNGYLFAQDTTEPDSDQRVAAIELLNVDSLVLRMRSDSLDQIMTLLRTSPPPE